MLKSKISTFVCTAATTGSLLLLGGADAHALQFGFDGPVQNDTDFNQILADDLFRELFVANGRIGNNSSTGGDWEVGIDEDVEAGQKAIGNTNFEWSNGVAVPFLLEYTNPSVTFTVGNNPGASVTFDLEDYYGTNIFNNTYSSGNVNILYLRTRAAGGPTISLTDLEFVDALNNVTNIGNGPSDTVSDPNYFYIAGNNVNGALEVINNFTLRGNVTMAWTGNPPSGSSLAFQIKAGFGEPAAIPTPALLPGLVGMGIAALRKKKNEVESEA